MHELALVESLLDAIDAQIEGARVKVVRLEVGRLVAVVPDAMRFCFEACTRGTPLEGAALEIAEIEGRGRCRSCARQMALDGVSFQCACGSFDIEVSSGHELRVREVEVV